jgi:hypothetical protein
MRSIATVLLVLALPSAAQAITPQQARQAPDTARLPGIVERGPPGTTRVPGIVEVRFGNYDPVVAHDLREARRSVERRRESGELSRREARRLKREARLIARMAYRYGRNGLSDPERRELGLRASVLRARSEAPRLASRSR